MMAFSGSSDPAVALAGVTLLRGRNTVLQPDRALSVAVGGTIHPTSAGGDGSTVEITLCRSATELARTLQWGVGLSGGVGPLSLLQARQGFFESLRTTVFSVSLVVQARRVLLALGKCRTLGSWLTPRHQRMPMGSMPSLHSMATAM